MQEPLLQSALGPVITTVPDELIVNVMTHIKHGNAHFGVQIEGYMCSVFYKRPHLSECPFPLVSAYLLPNAQQLECHPFEPPCVPVTITTLQILFIQVHGASGGVARRMARKVFEKKGVVAASVHQLKARFVDRCSLGKLGRSSARDHIMACHHHDCHSDRSKGTSHCPC